MNFNDNPQSKLNQQASQNATRVNQETAKKADIGSPKIVIPSESTPANRPPVDPPVGKVANDFGPALDTSSDSKASITDQKKGFKAHQQDAIQGETGDRSVKGWLKKKMAQFGEKKMADQMNPSGQPDKSINPSTSPLAPEANKPTAKPPTPEAPGSPPPNPPLREFKYPKPARPAIPRPKFGR